MIIFAVIIVLLILSFALIEKITGSKWRKNQPVLNAFFAVIFLIITGLTIFIFENILNSFLQFYGAIAPELECPCDQVSKEKRGPNMKTWELLRLLSIGIAFLLATLLLAFVIIKRATKIVGIQSKKLNAIDVKGIEYIITGFSPLEGRKSTLEASQTGYDQILRELEILQPEKVTLPNEGYDDAVINSVELQNVLGKKAEDKKAASISIDYRKWQQNLRVIWPHRKSLKKIIVITNDGGKIEGTGDFSRFKTYLNKAFDIAGYPNIQIEAIGDEVDDTVKAKNDYRGYDNLAYVDQKMREAIESLAKYERPGVEKRCLIDITPGQKTYSIVATALAFNNKIRLTYSDNDGVVHYYDYNLDYAPIAGL